MKAFFAVVLSTIAIGVLLIAYGLLSVRPDVTGAYPPPSYTGRAVPVSTTIGLPDDDFAYRGTGVREARLYPAPILRSGASSSLAIASQLVSSRMQWACDPWPRAC